MFQEIKEVLQSDKVGAFVGAFNSLLDKLSSFPLPIEYGTGYGLEYLKLQNGKVIIWGIVATGNKYMCKHEFSGEYGSDSFDVKYPFALANPNALVIPHCQTSPMREQQVKANKVASNDHCSLFFIASQSDQQYAASEEKDVHLLVIGDWK